MTSNWKCCFVSTFINGNLHIHVVLMRSTIIRDTYTKNFCMRFLIITMIHENEAFENGFECGDV